MKTLNILLIGFLGCGNISEAGGFFRRVPEVGEWARYDLVMVVLVTYPDENSPAPNFPEFTGTLTLKCVGEETINDVRHLWIESRLEFWSSDDIESDGSWMILKLLVPADHVTDRDLAPHVVRGWTHFISAEGVSEWNPSIPNLQEDPLHLVMLLSFPVGEEEVSREQNKTLTIDGEEVPLTRIETSPLAERDFEDSHAHFSGEATWWPSDDHAFGIAAAEQLWNMDTQEPFAVLAEWGMQMDLVETGTDAVSDLPQNN
jgi:hypothetical protein